MKISAEQEMKVAYIYIQSDSKAWEVLILSYLLKIIYTYLYLYIDDLFVLFF